MAVHRPPFFRHWSDLKNQADLKNESHCFIIPAIANRLRAILWQDAQQECSSTYAISDASASVCMKTA